MREEVEISTEFQEILEKHIEKTCFSCGEKGTQMYLMKSIIGAILSIAKLEEMSRIVYRHMKDNYGECTVGFVINSPKRKVLHSRFDYEQEKLMKFEDYDYSVEKGKPSLMYRSIRDKKVYFYKNLSRKQDTHHFRGMITEMAYFTPLIMNSRVIGGFTYQICDRGENFNYEEIRLAHEITPFLTIALNNLLYKEELKKVNKKLKTLSERDALTGLYNRRVFSENFEKAIGRNKDKKNYIFIMDLDDFKGVNDTRGHIYGDQVLEGVSKTLKEYFEDNYLGRFGGDEFIAGMIDIDNKKAIKICADVVEAIKNKREKSSNGKYMGISIGIVEVDERKSLEEYINDADTELYKMKGVKGSSFSYREIEEYLKDVR